METKTSTSKPAPVEEKEAPLDPSYSKLDPAYTYYNVAEVDELRDHYYVTFSEAEGAYCNYGISVRDGSVSGGCGFPATSLGEDTIPADRRNAIDTLKTEVLKQYPRARDIHARFEGRHRRVVVEEFRACDFQSKGMAHGHDYSRVELHVDEALTRVSATRFLMGSDCGALYCYWCTEPRWVPVKTTTPVIGIPDDLQIETLPPELHDAILTVANEPDAPWPLPND